MSRKNQFYVKKMTSGGVLLALGVVLPQIMHLGGSNMGRVCLPMHLGVLLGGLLLGTLYGGLLGALTPLVSAVLTGMPVMHKLPFMIIELMSYGIIAGLLSNKKINIYIKLISAQIAGRIVYGLALLFGAKILGISVFPVTSILTGIVTGLPGIIIQLIFAPVLVIYLNNALHFDNKLIQENV